MAFDPVTEVIAHFAGVFQIELEEARLRLQYEKFSALKAMEEEAGPPRSPITITIEAPYGLGQIDPEIKYASPPLLRAAAREVPAAEGVAPATEPDPVDASIVLPESQDVGVTESVVPTLLVPFPNSILTITYQLAELSDNDVLSFGNDAEFVSPAALADQLSALISAAQSLGGIGIDWQALAAGSEGSGGTADPELITVSRAAEAEGTTATLLQVDGGAGIFVNGDASEAMPEWSEVRPAILAPEPEASCLAAQSDTGEDNEPGPCSPAPGHSVVTGANLSVNEAFITTKWIDAPVIAVAGDVIEIDAVSQVNVLLDRDTGTGDDLAPSTAVNAVEISQVSSEDLQDGGITQTDLGLPSFWQLERIETDVVAVNWVEQHVFATDLDQVEIEFSGTATYMGLGENTIANSAAMIELGYHYDTIIVGGNMSTVNAVKQTNVLLDNDVVTGRIPPGLALSSHGNAQMNKVTLEKVGIDSYAELGENYLGALKDLADGGKTLGKDVAHDSAFQGKGHLTALYIAGNFTRINAVEQTNYVGDADQVSLALDDFVGGAGAGASVTTGSNGQLNSARISHKGLDSKIMAGGEVYSDALIYQAELIDTDAAPTGVGLAALANEAVAFLADGMIAEDHDPDFGASGADHGNHAHHDSLDALQSVLA